ncbi:uncharacterized protein PG998_013192 [Apiospora kogelbergensis]|uniref:uncharacterized protein n=1 Tax=Apiospora kogelbergensis TaxID=1337665 RepID=UPI00312E003B
MNILNVQAERRPGAGQIRTAVLDPTIGGGQEQDLGPAMKLSLACSPVEPRAVCHLLTKAQLQLEEEALHAEQVVVGEGQDLFRQAGHADLG